jgi:hypothetical protein
MNFSSTEDRIQFSNGLIKDLRVLVTQGTRFVVLFIVQNNLNRLLW